MMRQFILASFLGLMTIGLSSQPVCELPKPHYEPQSSDPPWLAYAAQFHGHLGPWATAGTRLGMAGLRHVDAAGYFDVEVTCEGPFVKPPKSCFLDGVQVATGATWGKRNLAYVQADEIAVRVKNTRSGKQVEVRPSAKLLELLHSFKPKPKAEEVKSAEHEHDQESHGEETVEALARRIAAMPEREILTVKITRE